LVTPGTVSEKIKLWALQNVIFFLFGSGEIIVWFLLLFLAKNKILANQSTENTLWTGLGLPNLAGFPVLVGVVKPWLEPHFEL
jgi:hypothetical protein